MKAKRKALIGLMALCLAGTIGGAAALVVNGTQNQSVGSGAADSAIYLHFDNTNSAVEPLQQLGVASQYRYVKVLAPSKSTSVTGNYQVSFALTPSEGEYTLAGVTCKIYQGLNSSTYVSAREADGQHPASVATNTLVGADSEVTQSYDVAVTSASEFYLEFNYVKDANNAKELGGSLIVSLDKVA